MEYAPEMAPGYRIACGQALVELYQRMAARIEEVAARCTPLLPELVMLRGSGSGGSGDAAPAEDESNYPKLKTWIGGKKRDAEPQDAKPSGS